MSRSDCTGSGGFNCTIEYQRQALEDFLKKKEKEKKTLTSNLTPLENDECNFMTTAEVLNRLTMSCVVLVGSNEQAF